MRVLHRRLTVGEAARGALEDDHPAVRRPSRAVLVALGGGQTPDRFVGQPQRVHVVVEELVVVGVTVGQKQQLLPVR